MDHSMHGGMDHSAHAGHAHHMGHGMEGMEMDNSTCANAGMMMWFHGGYCEIVLFTGWTISSVGGLIGSMVGIILIAAIYEGLKYYREYLFFKSQNALNYQTMAADKSAPSSTEDGRSNAMVGEVIHKQPPRMLCWPHAYQTLLHVVQLIMSYILMLVFMTYNYWLALAVLIGGAIGFFLFGWKKTVAVDVTEHCH